MGKLTEKEWTVIVNDQLTIEFYAELINGIVCDVYATIDLDGFHVTWSPLHRHGLIRVYEIGKMTNDWIRLLSLTGTQSEIVEASLKEFLNLNLTYKN